MDNSEEPIRHLSLCSGYEGIGLGLRRVFPNLIEVAFCEVESFAVANLVAKMEANQIHPAPLFTDLKKFPYREFLGKVDILSGGFPCQPFSLAGKRQATEDPRHLFPYIIKGITECQPRVCFLENVEGIIPATTQDGESVLQYVLRSLEELGYRSEAGIFSASEVGATHQRKRVFIMAYSSNKGLERILHYREPKEEVQKYATRRSRNTRDVELADTNSSRGREDWEQPKLWSARSKQSSRSAWPKIAEGKTSQGQERISQSWPSRPGEEQKEWEEPRVVVGNSNASGQQSSVHRQGQEQLGGASTAQHREETLGKLGRTIDGTPSGVDPVANRVDRLRLLGNGVVPQVAELAYRVLSERLEKSFLEEQS